MAVRLQHDQNPNCFYFITFTCHKWLQLFKEANAYDTVYKWFDYLFSRNIYVTAYVIMPNHVHVLLYFPSMPKSLNTIVGNAKRFSSIFYRELNSFATEIFNLSHQPKKLS